MAGEFTRHRVSELIASGALGLGDGYRAKNSELGDQGIPFARAGNIDGGFLFDDADLVDIAKIAVPRDKISHPDDTVFTSKGTVGRFARVGNDTPQFVYSPQLCYWRSLDTDFIDAGYLYYWLSGPEFYTQYKGVSGQTDMAEYVSLGDQRSMWITVPDLPHQKSIANLLGSLDEKIELNRLTAATLEEMARALFKSWFVDFDPVRARAEGRPTGLPDATSALFPSRFGDDGMPEGWHNGTLADVALLNLKSGGSASEGEIVYVDLANTKWGVIEQTQHFRPDDAPSRAQRILRSGDTIVGTVRPGNGSYALVASEGLTGSTGFAVLRPKTPSLREFVYLAATSGENIEALAALADGGAYPAVRPDVVAETPCCLPCERVFEAFHAVAVDLIDRIEAARSQCAALGAIRDTLLPKLISGELRIKDAKNVVEAA